MKLLGANKGKVELMGLIVFAVLLMVLIKVFGSVEGTINIASSTSEAAYAKGNASTNSWSAVQLSSVAPIIIGAVLVLSIIGMLYSRR